MPMPNPNDHINCQYNDNVEFPLIKIHKFAPTGSASSTIRNNLMIFILEGNLRYTMGNQRDVAAQKGDFILVPQGWTVEINIFTDTIIMVFRLLHRVSFCERFMVEQLVDPKSGKQKNGAHEKGGTDGGQDPIILKTNTPIWNYLWSLYSSIADGLICRNYFDVKIKELFYLLRTYYSKQELYGLFHPVASADTLFSDYVRHNYFKYKTVEALASSMNLTYSGFSRKFLKVFNQPPYQWIIEQKSDTIFAELTRGTKNLKQIAGDLGFLSPAQFNDFCKNRWGRTPGSIRKDPSAEEIKKKRQIIK